MSTGMGVDLSEFDDVPPAGAVEDLADGEYEFQFNGPATIKFVESKKYHVIERELTVISGGKHDGMVLPWPFFLKDNDAKGRLDRELKTLGFDSGKWTLDNGRPWSQEVQKALKCLAGMRFKGKKVTTGSGHFLNVVKRVDTDGLPRTFGPAELEAGAEKVEAEENPF